VIRQRQLFAALAGASAFALALAITEPLGPGLDPDGRSYLFTASTLAHRGAMLDIRDHWLPADSLRVFTRWPPAFPIAIAAPVFVGTGEVQGARIVMALSAAFTFGLLAWMLIGVVGMRAAMASLAVLAITPPIVMVHESVLSEPMFLAAIVLALAMMTRERPAPFASGSCAALASMVRYAGLGIVGAVVLWEFARRGSARERITRAALAAAPAIVVNAWWWLRAAHAGGRSAVRVFKVYGEFGPTLTEGGVTTAGWLAPGVGLPWGGLIAAGVAIAAGTLVWLGVRRAAREHAEITRIIRAAALLAAGYGGLLLAARVIADPDIPLDERLLAPAILLVTIIAALAIAVWWPSASRRARALTGAALVAWGVASLWVTAGSVQYALGTGSDYADRCWAESPVTQWVRDHGAGHEIVSNASVAIYFQAGRLAREMADDDVFPDSATMFIDTLAARRGVVALYDRSCAPTIEQPDELVAQLKLQLVERFPTGSIWMAPPPPAAPK
jgi:hypothetical protein